MKNFNTLSKTDYIEHTIAVSLCLAIVCRFLCFSGIHGITITQSKIVFWVLVVFLISLGAFITYKHRRTYISIFINAIFPFEVYIILATFRYIPTVYIVILSVAAFICLAYYALVLFQKIKNQNRKKEIVRNRVRFASHGARTIIAILLLLVTFPIGIKSAFGYSLMSSDVEVRIDDAHNEEWSIKNNIETIVKLQEDTWKTLSLSEKLHVLGVIKNIEMHYFGLNHEVYLEASKLEENILGNYDHVQHRITIDIEHLKTAPSKEVLGTLLHECKHVYDRMCVELYDHVDDEFKNMPAFKNIAQFKKEFNTPMDSEENFFEYYSQAIEVSARNYSEKTTAEYFEYIDTYLKYGTIEPPTDTPETTVKSEESQ